MSVSGGGAPEVQNCDPSSPPTRKEEGGVPWLLKIFLKKLEIYSFYININAK